MKTIKITHQLLVVSWFGRLAGLFTLFLLSALIPFYSLFAQVSGYTFTNTTGTYSGLNTNARLGEALNDDQVFTSPVRRNAPDSGAGIPIGFDFQFNGVTNRVFGLNTNGYIVLGFNDVYLGDYRNNTLSTSSNKQKNVISILNADISGNDGRQGADSSRIKYQTSGTPGSRVFTVEWYNYQVWGPGANLVPGSKINMQIKLYESTNIIEFVYGTMTTAGGNVAAQVGLRGVTGSDFKTVKVARGANWSTAVAGTVASDTSFLLSGQVITSGTIFRFTPGVSPGPDLAVAALANPLGNRFGCPGSSHEPVSVKVANLGNAPQNSVTLGCA
jgi:hypothetical protein